MTPQVDLDIGPATRESPRQRYETYTVTQPADELREKARDHLHKWICLHYMDNGEGKNVDGTVSGVTETDDKLIIELFLTLL